MLRLVVRCLFGLSVLLASRIAVAADEDPNRMPLQIALIVGISDYPDYGHLPSATNDAAGMARLARARDFDEVVLLTDAEATRDNIVAAIEDLHERLRPSDLLTIFYSGHAVRVPDGIGGMSGYLIPYGCHKGDEIGEALAMDEFALMLAELPNRYLTVFVDACHAGMVTEAIERGLAAPPPGAAPKRAVAVVASSAAGELAFESSGHGLFTGRLLSALATKEDDAIMGRLPPAELMQALHEDVRDETGGWQQPYVEQFGDWPQPIYLRGF